MSNKLALPSEKQITWQNMEMGMFCHFGTNTFTGLEWGDGTASPSVFNPMELDCVQWIKTAKDAGFKYFMLTAKHHDGFCLWPSALTDYSVKSSLWKNGKGDVVAECAEACKMYGIKFGVYLSPWDRHEPCYQDKEKYDNFYISQLTELLTGYGEIFEVWFDGAGSTGRVYDWARIIETVEKYQPNAVVFNMGKPSIRWVGNEDGFAPYPCWNSLVKTRENVYFDDMATWMPETPAWLPAECDVSITRPNWFWEKDNDSLLLTLDQLLEVYYKSVGYGANLLLNIPPDSRGLFPESYAGRVKEFGREIERRFSNPVGEISGDGYEYEIKFQAPVKLNHVQIMEDIRFGERVEQYSVYILENGNWRKIIKGTAIGHKKIDIVDTGKASGIKLAIEKASDVPKIRSLKVF